MSTIYRAFANGKEVGFYINGKPADHIYGGGKLLWRRDNWGEFKFTWSGRLAVRIWGNVKVLTGDGTTYTLKCGENDTDGKGLLYTKNDGQVYTATIRGNLSNIYFSNKTYTDYNTYRCDVIDVLTPFPKTMENISQFMSMGAFENCLKLQSIPEDLLINLPKLKYAYNMFKGTKLESIPQGLFRKNTEIESFLNTFYGTKIKSIPDRLFENNKKAISFASCFGNCTQLSAIPERLFAGLEKAEDFSSCFSWLAYDFNGATAPIPVRTIPENLFEGCISAKNFSSCFTGNAGLTSVPDSLFNDCPAETFNGCFKTGWWSSTEPMKYASLVSAPKLWEKFPNATGKGCFDGQYNLPWYYSTPNSWRENDKMYSHI